LITAFAAAGCATEDFVHETVAPVAAQAQRAQSTADEALQRADAAQRTAQGKFVYQVVLSDDSVKFPANGDKLSPEAQSRLAELALRLRTENRNVHLEIQGFTDSSGRPERNKRLGAQRAEAVREFLHEQGVALQSMDTISYGEAHPVAPNDTPQGRAQNRRVAIVVMS
jgi:outer membrane protein OmpA-like peptidoglycan-associated protein